jgi:hypothetical protein
MNNTPLLFPLGHISNNWSHNSYRHSHTTKNHSTLPRPSMEGKHHTLSFLAWITTLPWGSIVSVKENLCIPLGEWRVSQHSKSKKFLRMRIRKPRSNLGYQINERERERERCDLHTLEEIARQKCSTKHGCCNRTSLLLLAIRSDPTPQVATPPRDAHVQHTNDSSSLVQRDMVEW